MDMIKRRDAGLAYISDEMYLKNRQRPEGSCRNLILWTALTLTGSHRL